MAVRTSLLLVALLSLAAPAMAQQCSASASANAGDEVTVLAILHTADANENGEGEPLTVTVSNGGPSATFSDYEVTHNLTFKAPATAPVTATGTIAGFDGDESCEVSVSVNAKHRFSQTQKNALIAVTSGFGVASGLSWALAEGCLLAIVTGPICSMPAGLVAALSTTVATISGTLLAIDPIDLNYTVIALPIPAPITLVTAGNGLMQADADALNGWIRNQAEIVGVLRATVTSLNRASGAASVGNGYWEQRQQDAINGYMARLGLLLALEATARQKVVSTWIASAKPGADVTPQMVLMFEQRLASQGWRPDEARSLLGIGDDIAFIQAARPLIYTQDINAVAGGVPAAFAKRSLVAALRDASKALVPSVGTPQLATCPGVTVSSLATQYGGIINAAAALGFGDVTAFHRTIGAFCGS